MINQHFFTTSPSNNFFIGDVSSILTLPQRASIVDQLLASPNYNNLYNLNNHNIVLFFTLDGDGLYPSNYEQNDSFVFQGNDEIMVNGGVIGVCPIELAYANGFDNDEILRHGNILQINHSESVKVFHYVKDPDLDDNNEMFIDHVFKFNVNGNENIITVRS